MFKITADDFGYCPKRNHGIQELIDLHIVNSISVIINGVHVVKPSDCESVKIGLHLNLTEGKPISNPDNVKSLINDELMFHGKFGFRERLKDGNVRKSEIRSEIEEQINKFVSIYGNMPHYIDGHQHVHVLPNVRECLLVCMTMHKITETRIPFELGLSECDWIDKPRFEFYQKVCEESKNAVLYFRENRVFSTPYFIGLSTMSRDMSIDRFRKAMDLIYNDVMINGSTVSSQSIEFMVHPGYPSNGKDGGCGAGPDEFSRSTDRQYELGVLKSVEFRKMLEYYEKLFQGIRIDSE